MKLDIVNKTDFGLSFNVNNNKIAKIMITGGYYDKYFKLINYTNSLKIYVR